MYRLIWILLLFLQFGCGKKAEITVLGNISDLKGEKVYLYIYENNAVIIDSSMVNNGKFKFSLSGIEPQAVYLTINAASKEELVRFISEPGVINISGKADSIIVSGTESNELFMQMNQEIAKIKNLQKEVTDKFYALPQDDEAAQLVLYNQYDSLDKVIFSIEEDFVIDNPKTNLAAYLAWRRSFYKPVDEVDAVLSKLDPSLDSSKYVKSMRKNNEMKRSVNIGSPAPEFTQYNVEDSTELTLSSLKGKYVLLHLWASWEESSINDLKNIADLYKKYHGNNFEIVGVNLDLAKEDFQDILSEQNVTWPTVTDYKTWENQIAQSYYVKTLPYTILIDKDGVILGKNLSKDSIIMYISK